MTDEGRIQPLTELFAATAAAHHRAFLDTDGLDPEWPLWYARHLHGPLGAITHVELTESEIVYHLVAADRQQQRRDPGGDWTVYYARYFAGNDL